MVPAETASRRAAAKRRAIQSDRAGQPLHDGRSGGRYTGGGVRVGDRSGGYDAAATFAGRRRAVHRAGPRSHPRLPQRRLRFRPAQQCVLLGHVRAHRPLSPKAQLAAVRLRVMMIPLIMTMTMMITTMMMMAVMTVLIDGSDDENDDDEVLSSSTVVFVVQPHL